MIEIQAILQQPRVRSISGRASRGTVSLLGTELSPFPRARVRTVTVTSKSVSHALRTLPAMSLVSQTSKSEIWDLTSRGGRVPPILLQPRVLHVVPEAAA